MKVNHGTEMARMQAFQRRAGAIEKALDTAGKELTTGIKSDLHEATGGNLGKLHGIERSLARQAAYAQNITLVEQRLDGMQNALGKIQGSLAQLSVDMVSTSGINGHSASMTLAEGARLDFINAVSSLNSGLNGQSLFAGGKVDSAALAPGATILAELDALVASDATAADVIASVEAYFAKPAGGFHTSGYVGSAQDRGSVDVGAGQRIEFPQRADDDEIVATLKGLALAAVVAGGALDGDTAEQMDVIAEAGAQLLQASEGLLDYMGSLGVQQENVEAVKAHNVAETDALKLARVDLISADTTEAATVFQALEAQLETVYTVTSRLSNLTFTSYMR
jgi:flagellar hook-associated protein 3 FlgL